MLNRLENFMKYKRNSIFVYVFLLAVLTFMISLNIGRKVTSNSIENKKVSFPLNQEDQNSNKPTKTVFAKHIVFENFS